MDVEFREWGWVAVTPVPRLKSMPVTAFIFCCITTCSLIFTLTLLIHRLRKERPRQRWRGRPGSCSRPGGTPSALERRFQPSADLAVLAWPACPQGPSSQTPSSSLRNPRSHPLQPGTNSKITMRNIYKLMIWQAVFPDWFSYDYS